MVWCCISFILDVIISAIQPHFLTIVMQLTAMTVRINDMVRKAKMHHTELALIAVLLKMKVVVHSHLPFMRMKQLLHEIQKRFGVASLSFLPCSSPLFDLSSCKTGSSASRRPYLGLCQIRDSRQSSLCSFWLPRYSHPSFTLPDSSSLQEENFLQKW
jgi:hypothetical protein